MKKGAVCIMFALASCSNREAPMKAKNDTTNWGDVQGVVDTQSSSAKKPVDNPDSCEQLAERIMMSTAVFRQLEADSPHWIVPDLQDHTYTFQLYHDFEDHINTVAWIVVDLKLGLVYQQDIPNDTLLPVEFDRTLIGQIKTTCGNQFAE